MYFNQVHHGITLISICNAMLLISKRVGFAQNIHEPWAELVQKRVHQLIKATEPGGSVNLQIVLVEVGYHLPHIMKPIQKWRRRLGFKTHGRGNWYEPSEGRVLLQTEGRSFLNWYRFWGPPQSPVRDSIKAFHEEVASQIHIRLLQGNFFPWNFLIGCWNQNSPHPFLREFHLEEI